MKTMNKIFRTLLMTIALVMGVVNVQADPYYEGDGTTSIEFPYGTFDDYDASTTVLRVTYVIQPQSGWTPTYKINLGTRSGAYVSEVVTQNGTVDIPIEGYNNSFAVRQTELFGMNRKLARYAVEYFTGIKLKEKKP